MNDSMDHIREAVAYIQSEVTLQPEIGIILGTGLGNLAHEIDVSVALSYEDIPNFPVSTVESHAGKLIFGYLSEKPVVAMQGRFHYYEGYNMQTVTFPVRVMKLLGIELLVLSNAAGGVNPDMENGDLMIIEDHINLQPGNPLTGPNLDELGPRFPDMSEAYDAELIHRAKAIAEKHRIRHMTGVYAALPGPNLETKAEYRYIHRIGGDAVGMSTVPEVLVANHMGLRCFAISIITDIGYPSEKVVKVTVEDVIKVANEAEPKLTTIVRELLQTL